MSRIICENINDRMERNNKIKIDNIVDFDFASLMPMPITWVYGNIYGHEYHDLITERVNNTLVLPYDNINGIFSYINYLMLCQNRKYAVKFLKELRMDPKITNYSKPLSDEITKMLSPYIIGSPDFCFSGGEVLLAPIFRNLKTLDKKTKDDYQINLINHLLEQDKKVVTEENLTSFLKTKKGKEISDKIKEIGNIYLCLLEEYKSWVQENIEPIKRKLMKEDNRRIELIRTRTIEFYEEMKYRINPNILEKIKTMDMDSKLTVILGTTTINNIPNDSLLQYFTKEKMQSLLSEETDIGIRMGLFVNQINYLNKLNLEELEFLKSSGYTKENLEKYCNLIQSGKLDEFLPDEEYINKVFALGQEKYEKSMRECIETSQNFQELLPFLGNDENIKEFIYQIIINQTVCTLQALRNDQTQIAVIVHGIRSGEEGKQLYLLMNEMGNAIELNEQGMGFNLWSHMQNNIKNRYDDRYYKYEKINEAIKNIFTIEAVTFLRTHFGYLTEWFEPQEIAIEDYNNSNTLKETKEIIMPLIEKFREQVISAQLHSKIENLTTYIGEENFEQLVDVINKVEYLGTEGLRDKLDNNIEDNTTKEYREAKRKADEIYKNIDSYYSNHFPNTKRKITTRNNPQN